MRWALVCLLMWWGGGIAWGGVEELRAFVAEAEAAYAEGRALLAEAAGLEEEDEAGAGALRGEALRAFRRSVVAYDGALLAAREAGIENGGLHYNRGNALLLAGKTGGAVAAYLRAERLGGVAGGDLSRNLAIARGRVTPEIEGASRGVDRGPVALGPVVWAHRAVSGEVKLWVFVVSAAVFWGLMGVRLFDRGLVARRVALVFFGVALVASGSVAADVFGERARVGVVIDGGVVARTGPGDGYGARFTGELGSGVEMTMEEERAGWVRGRLADGRVGWVERGVVEVVE